MFQVIFSDCKCQKPQKIIYRGTRDIFCLWWRSFGTREYCKIWLDTRYFGAMKAYLNRLKPTFYFVIFLTGRMHVHVHIFIMYSANICIMYSAMIFFTILRFAINSKNCYSKWLAINASMHVVKSWFSHMFSFVTL